MDTLPVGIDDIRRAHDRIRPHVHRTPVLTSAFFDTRTGARVFFKCENFQKTGSFKFRGACNAVFSLRDDELANGVLTGSSGNHGQALARAAGLRNARAVIVMPENATAVKVAAVKGYGGEVIFADPDPAARLAQARRIEEERHTRMVHPFNDPHIVAGQGTAAVELLEQGGPLDTVLVPVGGGGLASGTALAGAALAPDARVVGVEPQRADDACRSLEAGRILPSENPRTVADGLRSSLGDVTFAVLRRHLHSIVTVSEDSILNAMRLIWERMKIVIEPSAAVPVAAILDGKADIKGERVGVILSGGNVDLDRLPWSRSGGA
jgi:threonine dehydratase